MVSQWPPNLGKKQKNCAEVNIEFSPFSQSHHSNSLKYDSCLWQVLRGHLKGPSHKLLFAEVNNLHLTFLHSIIFETQARQLMGFCCCQGQILVFQRKAPSGALGFHEEKRPGDRLCFGTRDLCQIWCWHVWRSRFLVSECCKITLASQPESANKILFHLVTVGPGPYFARRVMEASTWQQYVRFPPAAHPSISGKMIPNGPMTCIQGSWNDQPVDFTWWWILKGDGTKSHLQYG